MNQVQKAKSLEAEEEDSDGPPCYQMVLLEDHLSTSKTYPNLYPPDLLKAIQSFLLHPTVPPPHPHRTYHTMPKKCYSDGEGHYYGEIDPKLRRNGYGHMVYDNGDSYQGFWKKNTRDGLGSYFWSQTGSVYWGQFQNGERSGHGDFVFGPRRKDDGRVVISGVWQKGRVKDKNNNSANNKLIFVNAENRVERLHVENISRIL